MGVVTASTVIQFDNQTDTSAIFSAEVDSRDDGLNLGKTSFSPGNDVGILLYKSRNVVLDFYDPSYGSLVSSGTVNYQTEDEFISFAGNNEVSLSKPLVSGFSYKWLGNNLGSIIPTENKLALGNTNLYPENGQYVGVAKISYMTTATAFWLKNTNLIGEDTYQIVAFFVGHTG
jgi:hypothetical protein